jgi:hypothetical protein
MKISRLVKRIIKIVLILAAIFFFVSMILSIINANIYWNKQLRTIKEGEIIKSIFDTLSRFLMHFTNNFYYFILSLVLLVIAINYRELYMVLFNKVFSINKK